MAQQDSVVSNLDRSYDITLVNDVFKIDDHALPSSGFYVKKGLGIHGGVVLSNAYENTYLDTAQIVGDGVFLITGDGKHNIIAHNSEVENLLVNTIDTVKVKGVLNITQSLVVESGVFNVSQSKSFSIEENAVVWVGECADLFFGEFLKDHYKQNSLLSGMYVQLKSNFSVNLNRRSLESEKVCYESELDLMLVYMDNWRASEYNRVVDPPPRYT